MKKWYSIINDNCLKVLKELPENSIDMIFADPPYLLSNGGITCKNGKMVSVNKGKWDKAKSTQEDFDFHFEWISECRRVLKDKGTIWISGTYHSIYKCGFALELNGYHLLNDISWFKPNASPNLSCRFFTASHESLLWARKSKKSKHTFNYDAMKNGSFPDDKIKKVGKQMRSVWWIASPRPDEKTNGKHPTQKPRLLLERIILASTNPGDVILDPFAGSSSSGVAAIKHERNFIGIELDKNFCDLSLKNLRQVAKNYKELNNKPPIRDLIF